MSNPRVVVALLATLSTAAATYAQDLAPASPTPATGFDVHGSVDVGYRFTDVTGSTPTFRQLFNLSDGPRLFGVDVHGTAADGSRAFADTFALSASGLGGDPFPTVQLTVRKSRLYDLRVNWRASRFFDIAPQTPASISGFDTQAVTDRHAWNTSRQIGNVAWTMDATNRLHFLFNYDRVTNAGALQTTRALDYVGSSAVWGTFARANPYQLFGPVNNTANRVSGGASYGRDRWTVNYQIGYQVYEEGQTLDPVATPERSINVADPTTASELLSTLGWSQSRRLTTPTSQVSFVARPAPKVDWRGEYLFYRSVGPFSLNAAYQGVARTNTGATAVSSYDVALSARGEVAEPNHVLQQGLTYRPFDRWAFDVDYRYARSTTDTTAQLGSVVALYPVATETPASTVQETSTAWRQTIHSLDVTTTYTPTAALTIRPGVRMSQRDVAASEDQVMNAGASGRERTLWPEISVGYRPNQAFSARGSYRTSYSDAFYTRMSAVRRSIGLIVLRIEPASGFSVEAGANRTDAELLDAGYISHMRTASVTAAYALSDRLSLTGGLDWQSFLGTGTVTFLRGTAPITDVPMNDREVDRVWHAGISAKATARLGMTASANFDRTTGFDTIAGEPPLYGPMSFPYGTGSVYYEIPRAGRLSIDLQRTYLLQDLLPVNNFRANLLTLRFSRAF